MTRRLPSKEEHAAVVDALARCQVRCQKLRDALEAASHSLGRASRRHQCAKCALESDIASVALEEDECAS